MKKILFKIMLFFFVIILCGCQKEENKSIQVNFLDKCAFEEVDDNWIYYFCTSYFKDENGNFTRINEHEFNGVDLLKKDISDEFKIPVIDGATGEIVNYYTPSFNALLYGTKTRDEVKKINAYFNGSKFNSETIKEDLNELQLKYIDVDLIVSLYEKSLTAEEKEFGKFGNFPFVETIDKEVANGTIRIGYIMYYGDIEYIRIDFIDKNGEFLSEIVKENDATKEQIDDYNEILKLEEEIIKSQELEIDIQYEGKYFSFTSLSQMLKGLKDN